MIPKDVTISKGLAEYIMTKVLERTSNAVELCAMINPQEDILQECLKMPYEPNFSKFSRDYVLAQLDRVRKKEQEHNKKVEPAEKTLAQAPQDKNGKTGTKSLASRQQERS